MCIKTLFKHNILINYTKSDILTQKLVLLPVDWMELIHYLQNSSK